MPEDKKENKGPKEHTWRNKGQKLTKLMTVLNYGVWEDSWESLGLQGDPTSPF